MEREELMKKYQSGELGPEDQKLLEAYIENGIISLDELEDLDRISQSINSISVPAPSDKIKSRFYEMLSVEKTKVHSLNLWNRFWNILAVDLPVGQFYRMAFTASILAIGLFIGFMLRPVNKYQDQLSTINSEVLQMKEIMMLSMLENPLVTDRLKAVSMSSEIPASYWRVIGALFNTLNNDKNVNVRLAALEAITQYAEDPEVRENLIKSISMQESPLVQIQLADIMVALQEKKSVEEFKKIIQKDNTDPSVKEQLEESIGRLI